MTQPAAPAPGAAPTAPSGPGASSLPTPRTTGADRAAAITARLREEENAPPETAAEGEAAAPAAGSEPSVAASVGETPAAPDDNARRRQERLARIEQIRQKESAAAAKRQEQEQRQAKERQSTSEVETLRKRLAELEPLSNIPKSPEALLAWAEEQGLSSTDLVQYMRQRLSDPGAIAQQKVKTETDQLRKELEEVRAEMKRRDDEFAKQQEHARAQYEAQQRAHEFIQQASASADHPLTGAFLKRHGPQGLVAWANQFVAPLLPESYNLSELHDHVEQLLEEIQLGGESPAPASPANGTSQPSKSGAAKPITTLSNTLAGERSTVQEAIPLHKLPLDKRVELIKARYERE